MEPMQIQLADVQTLKLEVNLHPEFSSDTIVEIAYNCRHCKIFKSDSVDGLISHFPQCSAYLEHKIMDSTDAVQDVVVDTQVAAVCDIQSVQHDEQPIDDTVPVETPVQTKTSSRKRRRNLKKGKNEAKKEIGELTGTSVDLHENQQFSKSSQQKKKKPPMTEAYKCEKHNFVFETEEDLAAHISEDLDVSVEKVIRYRNRVCPKSKKKQSKAAENDANASETSMVDTQRVRYFTCPFCFDKWVKVTRLQKHLDQHHPDGKSNPVMCDMCGVELKNKHSYRGHVKEVHEGHRYRAHYVYRNRELVCELCGYTTHYAVRLRNHKLYVHEGIMPYACTMCSYTTRERSQFYHHKLSHEGRKLYNCEFCSYGVNLRQTFVNHCRKMHGIEVPKGQRTQKPCLKNFSFLSRNRPDPVRVGENLKSKMPLVNIKTERADLPLDVEGIVSGSKILEDLEIPIAECPADIADEYAVREEVSKALSIDSSQIQYIQLVEVPGSEGVLIPLNVSQSVQITETTENG